MEAKQSIFLDVPALNPSAVSLAENYGMQASFETVRMYLGGIPDTPLNRLFGITSFEVG